MTYYELLRKISAGGGIAFTHSGHFHADDVFSAALLRYAVNPALKIIRSRGSIPAGFKGLTFDVGGGEFDHHGPNPERRPNGIPYASFGLLWRTIGPIYGRDIYKMIDSRLVQPIDDADNGGKPCLLSNVIRSMNPTWLESPEMVIDSAFERAVGLALTILSRQIEVAQAELTAKPIIEQAIESAKNGIVEIPRPGINCVHKLIGEENAKLLIYPAQNSSRNWNVQTVPVAPGSREQKVKIASYDDDFSHGVRYRNPNGFLVTCDDYESAKKLADLSVA